VVPATTTSAASASISNSKLGMVPLVANGNAIATPSDGNEASPSHRSCGVTADLNTVTTVNESVLSLLLHLHRRFSSSKSRAVYQFSLVDAQASIQSRVGNAEFFIRKVLDKFCMESGICREAVWSLCQQHATSANPPTGEPDLHKDDEDERYFISMCDVDAV
jgi:hypothetical protein